MFYLQQTNTSYFHPPQAFAPWLYAENKPIYYISALVIKYSLDSTVLNTTHCADLDQVEHSSVINDKACLCKIVCCAEILKCGLGVFFSFEIELYPHSVPRQVFRH